MTHSTIELVNILDDMMTQVEAYMPFNMPTRALRAKMRESIWKAFYLGYDHAGKTVMAAIHTPIDAQNSQNHAQDGAGKEKEG